ncbi:hypothetical protein F6R98_15730 [Candidatus Methylospira mobilis]|uniref:Lipoprotein n=1 Tax=Candidatus Methylospira mobilis TaxID=1808979 RepID=A0A5Q0BJB7_9GAMM|nr:hypothetical protein [Candidatus Methylospira mobilis]QFY43900.1 hypothetical protein F6R98_15730 [Candidatus Methylospira mobilis]WNV04904.1 hypothetical protein RP726_00445 [Candidatus Methylospira mobilis]
MRSLKFMYFRSILLAVIVSSGLSACGGGMGGGGYPMAMGGMGYGMGRGPATVFGSPYGWGRTQNDVIVDSNRDRTVAVDNNNGWNRERNNAGVYDNREQGWERGGGFYHPGRI